MNIQVKSVFLSAALAALMLPAVAQDSTTTTPAPEPPQKTQPKQGTIRQRDRNQQERIANGIKTGELTPGEAARIEGQEKKLNNEVKDMRAADGGKLSAADKAKVEGQENKMSREIYNQKHDAQTTNGNGSGNGRPETVGGRRMDHQQDRIGNGVANGSLTPGEASRLEHQEQGIHQEAREMRAADGGKLTQADKEKLNHQQNQESRRIYRAKHNGRHR